MKNKSLLLIKQSITCYGHVRNCCGHADAYHDRVRSCCGRVDVRHGRDRSCCDRVDAHHGRGHNLFHENVRANENNYFPIPLQYSCNKLAISQSFSC